MTKKEKASIAKLELADIEAQLREMCIASVRHDELKAQMNERLTALKQKYDPELSAFQLVWDRGFEVVAAWAEQHPEAFATRRSVATLYATMGYRTGQPQLKTLKGVTWEKVCNLLKDIMPVFVREKVTVDKEGIMAARAEIGENNLHTLGLCVEQTERFFVEPQKEAVKLEKSREVA